MKHLILKLDPAGDPARNMTDDEDLALQVRRGLSPSVLRIYGWNQPTISLGRRQAIEDLPPELRRKGLPIVRRPTGGGAVVHDREELTYALALPQAVLRDRMKLSEVPGWLHRQLMERLKDRGLFSANELVCVEEDRTPASALCFQSPVRGDLLYQGRKVAGSALRVWREGLLLQGSIQALAVPHPLLRDELKEAVALLVHLCLQESLA